MAGVGDAAAPGEGGGGGVDGPQRDGRGEAEQPGGSGGQGPPPAPQLTETLGFYESDRRRERRRGRTADGFWNLSVPGCVFVCVHPASFKSFPGTIQAPHFALLWLKGQTFASACPGV
ncbi:TAPT1 isoform 3 [Pan troglodytes]|uniref:Transmembrane anterior posterior transformation 1 n=2 Tax=Homininae TaxID=207598 RepID=D6RBK3_HUMAN|nr:transmembrane anterior posterior transformation 1 [Homo sapiens]KAI4024954.1 transmembrane anterior posterior transformation 1 [Homo sapiens]PNI76056.1 TAPT1 isoform 3 [Pan troglodytes]